MRAASRSRSFGSVRRRRVVCGSHSAQRRIARCDDGGAAFRSAGSTESLDAGHARDSFEEQATASGHRQLRTCRGAGRRNGRDAAARLSQRARFNNQSRAAQRRGRSAVPDALALRAQANQCVERKGCTLVRRGRALRCAREKCEPEICRYRCERTHRSSAVPQARRDTACDRTGGCTSSGADRRSAGAKTERTVPFADRRRSCCAPAPSNDARVDRLERTISLRRRNKWCSRSWPLLPAASPWKPLP